MEKPKSAIVVESDEGVYTIAFFGDDMDIDTYYDFLMELKAREDWVWNAIEEGRVSVSTLAGEELEENLHFTDIE